MGTGREWIREGEATWGNVTMEKGVSSGSSILPLSLVPAFSPSFRVAEITYSTLSLQMGKLRSNTEELGQLLSQGVSESK